MEPTANAVRTSVDDGIGVVTLADARRRNPLSVATMRAVTAALRTLSDDGVGAIVLTHEGPAFSAGHDLAQMVGRTLDEEREVFAVCTEMMATMQEIPQPVIAAVDGMADRGRLPAGRHLRPRGGVDGVGVRHPGRAASGCSARRRWSRLSGRSGASARCRCC